MAGYMADSQDSILIMRGDVSEQPRCQRTSTGPIVISEADANGKYILLEYSPSGPNRQDVNLDGWKLRRTVNGRQEYTYNFGNFTMKVGMCAKIMARGAASEAGMNDLVFTEEETWGVGTYVNTRLIDDKGEEIATHLQENF